MLLREKAIQAEMTLTTLCISEGLYLSIGAGIRNYVILTIYINVLKLLILIYIFIK